MYDNRTYVATFLFTIFSFIDSFAELPLIIQDSLLFLRCVVHIIIGKCTAFLHTFVGNACFVSYDMNFFTAINCSILICKKNQRWTIFYLIRLFKNDCNFCLKIKCAEQYFDCHNFQRTLFFNFDVFTRKICFLCRYVRCQRWINFLKSKKPTRTRKSFAGISIWTMVRFLSISKLLTVKMSTFKI
jgi:hypothetical protein